MPTRSPLLRIHDMLESIRGIEKAIAGKNFRDFERSWVLRSAIERGIEVISEASRHLGRELVQSPRAFHGRGESIDHARGAKQRLGGGFVRAIGRVRELAGHGQGSSTGRSRACSLKSAATR